MAQENESTAPAQVIVPAGAQTDPNAGGDFNDYTVDTSPAEPADEPEREAAPDVPEDDPAETRMRTLELTIEKLERGLAESREVNARALAASQQAPQVADEPPIPFDQLRTAQDVTRYMQWENAQREKDIRASASRDAQAVYSAERARGLLSSQALGVGNDYDNMISRYVEPLERANPATKQLFLLQDDPALARYAMAKVLQILEHAKGDPVATFKTIDNALGARKAASNELVDRIRAGQASGAARTRLRSSTQPAPKGPLTEERIKQMSNEEFKRAMAARDRRMFG